MICHRYDEDPADRDPRQPYRSREGSWRLLLLMSATFLLTWLITAHGNQLFRLLRFLLRRWF